MSDSEDETKDKQLKIAILGDGASGKVCNESLVTKRLVYVYCWIEVRKLSAVCYLKLVCNNGSSSTSCKVFNVFTFELQSLFAIS